MNVHKVSTQIGDRELTIETGKLAKQADGSVIVRYGETVVLVTACAAKQPREGLDFFPLTVDYRENFYAAGKIPGGFFKREGKPSEREVLNSRLIDRPIRPLFAEGFKKKHRLSPWFCQRILTLILRCMPLPARRLRFTYHRFRLQHPSRPSASG